jgi:hypothetical protein
LKENESFFVYEVDPLSEEEEAVVLRREEELKKDYVVGEVVLAEGHDLNMHKAEISNIKEGSLNFPDQNEKPEMIYTLLLENEETTYHGTRRIRKIVENPPKIDVCIKHVCDSHSHYYTTPDAFGMPQHLHLPTRQLTNHDVLELVHEKIALYVNDAKAFTVYWKMIGIIDSSEKLVDDDEPFRLTDFTDMESVPEIYVYWSNPEGYKELVETEVHTLRRQESAIANTLSIHACLKKFCETEILDDMNMVYCRVCKEHQNSKKTTTIWKLPDQLIIHFKRFSYGGDFADKVTTPVKFPLTDLDLSQYVVHEEGKEGCIYDLYGVSNHSGFLAGGHYTAYVRSLTDGKWYEMDDTDVTEVKSIARITSKRAYLLFYRRRQKGESAPISIPILDTDVNDGDDEDQEEMNAQPMSGEAGETTAADVDELVI